MNGGTLQSLINEAISAKVDIFEDIAASIMRDIFQGLAQMHEKNFIHRDLKTDNILLNITVNPDTGRMEYQAKIADFGLSAEYQCKVYT